MKLNINPEFEKYGIGRNELKAEAEKLAVKPTITPHDKILNHLLSQIQPIDFQALAFPDSKEIKTALNGLKAKAKAEPDNDALKEQIDELKEKLAKYKVQKKHYLVLSIESVLILANKNNWGLCRNHDFIYLYNGTYWNEIDNNAFQKFLGEAAEYQTVPLFDAKLYSFRGELFKQFLDAAYLPSPEVNNNIVLINLQNGTFEISADGTKLRPFDRSDFITYQLPFEYNPDAKAPIFETYLNRVLPDIERQRVLAEYLGYVFIKHGGILKLEAALILYGTGANGKSVFYEIVNSLLGQNNTSSYSLQELTDNSGYYRAMIANKLVNYASEINGKLEADMFKRMVSGEELPARLPYGKPMLLKQYAKFIFNCNELPKDVEHTNAFFRRWIIIPFDVTIPKEEQDSQLHIKIIQNELSGVFNWVLDGLNRLLVQKRFSECEAAKRAVEQYKVESDSVQMYLGEYEYSVSPTNTIPQKDLYNEYKSYCIENGFKPVSSKNFADRLRNAGFTTERKNFGMAVFAVKKSFF